MTTQQIKAAATESVGRDGPKKTMLYAIFAKNTGNWEYEMVWGDYQRVYADADDCRLAKERLNSMIGDDAPDDLEYYALEVDPDDEIGNGDETAAEHLAAAATGSYFLI